MIYRSIFFLITMTDPHDMLSWASFCFATILITFCFYFLLFSFMFVLWVKYVNHLIEKNISSYLNCLSLYILYTHANLPSIHLKCMPTNLWCMLSSWKLYKILYTNIIYFYFLLFTLTLLSSLAENYFFYFCLFQSIHLNV